MWTNVGVEREGFWGVVMCWQIHHITTVSAVNGEEAPEMEIIGSEWQLASRKMPRCSQRSEVGALRNTRSVKKAPNFTLAT